MMIIMLDKKRVRGIPGYPPIQLEGIFKGNQTLLHKWKDVRGGKSAINPPFRVGGKNRQVFRDYLMELEEK